MKHKIRVHSRRMNSLPLSGFYLWYVQCRCRWEPATLAPVRPGGPSMFGRTTWDAAFALGIAHLKDKENDHA